MDDMAISKDLKASIEANQNQLKTAIRNHQVLVTKLKEDPDNIDLQKQIEEAQQQIVVIGLEQKGIIERLRKEYKAYQKNLKANATKNGVEDRRFNLTNALNRARKQNIITRSTSATSFSLSDESRSSSTPSTPEPVAVNPINPYDISQSEFLTYFGLATHDVYKEMQSRRAERKRRSTANPQFLYTRGWDLSSKRKRNLYLAQNISPPNTRQAVRNKNKAERTSPPKNTSRPSSPAESSKKGLPPFPTIPNLPSGLTIERVHASRSGVPDTRLCIECRLSGTLLICETCENGFHLSCHNRPIVQQPRQCPRCLARKEMHTVGSLNVPSGMSVSYVSSEITDKLQEKTVLLEKNKTLTAELTQLQDRHSQLTISLKNQQSEREELLMTQQSTEDKIKQILTFISSVKGSNPENVDGS